MVVKIVACDKEDPTFGCMKVINIKILTRKNLVWVVFHIPGHCYLFTDLKKLILFYFIFYFIPYSLQLDNMTQTVNVLGARLVGNDLKVIHL